MSRHKEQAAQATAGDAHAERRRLLEEAIEREWQEILNHISFHVWRSRLAANHEAIAEQAREVLQETVTAAFGSADTYDPSRSAKLWLFGVALIVIKRKLRERGRFSGRLILVADSEMARHIVGDKKARRMSDADLLDVLSSASKQATSQSPTAEELLSLVTGDDREILRLHYIEGLGGEELAARFGVSKETAYQRLSRARINLRRVYFGAEN